MHDRLIIVLIICVLDAHRVTCNPSRLSREPTELMQVEVDEDIIQINRWVGKISRLFELLRRNYYNSTGQIPQSEHVYNNNGVSKQSQKATAIRYSTTRNSVADTTYHLLFVEGYPPLLSLGLSS